MKSIDETTKPHHGIVNFERRKYPRVNVDLPVEYYRTDLTTHHNGRAINASEEGLLLYLPEQMEIDQHLRLKLFFTSGSELNTAEILVKVVWVDIYPEKNWGDYRTGVSFMDVSPEDMTKLRNFLRSLLG